MARPLKKGLDYFSFDTDFFSDRKIKALKGKYGNDGVIIYIYLLTLIYNENGYYMEVDEDLNYILSDTFKASDEKIGQIINFLAERSLFDNTLFSSDKVLTSRSIQLRFQEAKKGAKREIEVDDRFWILEEKETQSFIKCTHFQSYSEKNRGYSEKNLGLSHEKLSKEKKSKEKKRKVEESTEKELLAEFGFSPTMENKISEWLQYKKERKDKYTDTGMKNLFKIIQNKISENGETAVSSLINESMANGWKGIIWDRLKNVTPPAGTAASGTYDYDALERQMWDKLEGEKQ